MRPEIIVLWSEMPFIAGLGVRRHGDKWRYYLPFKTMGIQPNPDGALPGSTIAFVLAVSGDRIVALSPQGELALIDLIAHEVTARQKIVQLPYGLQCSADGRLLFVHDVYRLYVLDAATLEVVQQWGEIERIGESWAPYAANDAVDVRERKIAEGALDALHLAGPFRELGPGKLEARFAYSGHGVYGPPERDGFCVFDLATGAVARNRNAALSDAAPPAAWQIGQSCSFDSSPADDHPGFHALVAREAAVTLVVADDSLDAALAALDDLAGRMERDLWSLYCGGCIRLRFELDGETIDAGSLFDRFEQENCFKAVPTLRRLMLAYLNNIGDGGDGNMPWHASGQAQRALRALVLLDPGSLDVYRLDVEKGDPEHEDGPEWIYADYLGRHGARDEADLRFGVYFTIKFGFEACADPSTLFKGAERLVTPQRFAELVIEEANHRQIVQGWDRFFSGFIRYLGRNASTALFWRRTREILASRI